MVEAGMDQIKVGTREITPEIYEVKIEGYLDWNNAPEVEKAIESVFQRGIYKLVVNLKLTKFISSTGFGCLISSLEKAVKNKGDIIFAATPPEILDVFNILGLSQIMKFADDEAEAVGKLKS